MKDLISRQAAIESADEIISRDDSGNNDVVKAMTAWKEFIKALPSVQPQSKREWYQKGYEAGQKSVQPQRWIPVTEALPEDLEAVNITWVNHEPEPYYHDIKDKNFVATGIHYRDKWYWYSTTCADFLGEYGSNEVDEVDDAVEIIAWIPLPPSYKGGQDE